MGSAPKLGLRVHHQTDHVFDTVGMERMRYLTKSKQIGEFGSSEGYLNENIMWNRPGAPDKGEISSPEPGGTAD